MELKFWPSGHSTVYSLLIKYHGEEEAKEAEARLGARRAGSDRIAIDGKFEDLGYFDRVREIKRIGESIYIDVGCWDEDAPDRKDFEKDAKRRLGEKAKITAWDSLQHVRVKYIGEGVPNINLLPLLSSNEDAALLRLFTGEFTRTSSNSFEYIGDYIWNPHQRLFWPRSKRWPYRAELPITSNWEVDLLFGA